MKNEDPSVFVGLDVSCSSGRLDFGIVTRPAVQRNESPIGLFVHAKSNISRSQIIGLMKAAICRAVDGASSEARARMSIIDLLHEFLTVGHDRKLFVRAISELRTRYPTLTLALHEIKSYM